MNPTVKSDILSYLANEADMMKKAKKALRSVGRKDLPALENDFYHGDKLLDGSAICGERFLLFKHEGIILRYGDCFEAYLKRNSGKRSFRKLVFASDVFLNPLFWGR